jgi:hypothetical protein
MVGDKGPTGGPGMKGMKGYKGMKGMKGMQGIKGVKGMKGVLCTLLSIEFSFIFTLNISLKYFLGKETFVFASKYSLARLLKCCEIKCLHQEACLWFVPYA